MSRPVDVLAAVRGMLAPGGTVIVADERVADAFHAPADPNEQLFYGYSVLDCLPAGMMSKPLPRPGRSCGATRCSGTRWRPGTA